MQNLSAAYSEASTLRKAYINTGTLENSIKFIIPVYENMPSTIADKPQSNGIIPGVTGEKVTVKTSDNSGVKLRKGPGTSYNMVAGILDGTVGTRIRKNVAYANGYWWDEVDFGNGLKGYVASKYLI